MGQGVFAIADVFLRNGTHVNHELVKGGWCWWYRKYAPLDDELEELEKDARDAKKGLWADKDPMPPWEWRKGRKSTAKVVDDTP
jgi:endonuclease YncB( thermonuclease family)